MKLETVPSANGLIDTHCHLDFIFDRIPERFLNFKAFKQYYHEEFPESFSGCIAVFCNPHNWCKFGYEDAILSDDDVWCTFGVHPHHANHFDTKVQQILEDLLKRQKVVALGEIGLDYSLKNSVNHEIQKRTFLVQIQMALERNLAICLHIRSADEDGLRILAEAKVPKTYPIHLHCFSSDWNTCQRWMENYPNLKVGFTPLITYPRKYHLQEVVSKIPLARVLLETDSPYFLPSQKNYSLSGVSHPGFVIFTANHIASVKNITVEDVIKANRRNVQEIYKI